MKTQKTEVLLSQYADGTSLVLDNNPQSLGKSLFIQFIFQNVLT